MNEPLRQLLFVLFFLSLVTALVWAVERRIHRRTRQRLKEMTEKTFARITSCETRAEDAWDPDTGKNEKTYRRFVWYEFSVGARVYHGSGEVFLLGSKKKTKIYYDPENPAKNTTAYAKRVAAGTHIIYGILFALLLIFGIPLLLLFLLG